MKYVFKKKVYQEDQYCTTVVLLNFFLILFGFFSPKKKIKNTLIKTCSLNLNPAINCHSYVNYIHVNICFSTVLAISSTCMK